ncbi:MAG TPA: fatty acid desaturase [Rhizomicrobium sp.]|jgi:fatty acid desaturase
MPASTRRSRLSWYRWELPTWGVAAAVYGGFLLVTWNFQTLPLWLAAPSAALLLAWHGSLQHETIHGHPTRLKCVNTAIGAMPLALWLPYSLYRESHLRHHAEASTLTLPGRDPESHYLTAGARSSIGLVGHAAMQLNCTLAGRLMLGPAITMLRLWAGEFRRPVDGRHAGVWLRHVIGVVVVLGWVVGVCGISLPLYLGTIVYPSVSLALLRSFAEHRAAPDPGHRTAIVEAHPLWALLFLNNQLHFVHHEKPHLPWYDMQRAWREMKSSAEIGPGLLFAGGYREIARKYLFRPFIVVEHPGWEAE